MDGQIEVGSQFKSAKHTYVVIGVYTASVTFAIDPTPGQAHNTMNITWHHFAELVLSGAMVAQKEEI